MGLPADAILSLVLSCAPMVAPETALRVVRMESGGNPYAIGVNGPYAVKPQPVTMDQALATANRLLSMPGVTSIDVGLGGLNTKTLARMGVPLEKAFDACHNLGAMQRLLQISYARAALQHGPGQRALQQALSEYNTGHPVRGLTNGYVSKLYVQTFK